MKKWLFPEPTVHVSPSIVVFTVAFLLSLYFVFYVQSVLTMLFVAVIVMSAINPGVTKLEQKLKVPRILGIILIYVLLITFISLMLSLVVPPLLIQLQNLANVSHVFDLAPLRQALQEFKFDLTQINGFVDRLGDSVNRVFAIISSTFSGIFTAFTVTVMSFYLLIERKVLYRKIGWFTRDKRYFDLAEEYIDRVEQQLGGWVRGQVILMLVIGVITYIGLTLLSVPYAVPLAILAGFLEILPNLGPTIAAVPAVALAFILGGPAMAGIVTLFYVIVQQLENNIIVPKIMKDNVDVNPLATIITILVGLKVAGVLGALLSVPVYIVIRTFYSMYRREKLS